MKENKERNFLVQKGNMATLEKNNKRVGGRIEEEYI